MQTHLIVALCHSVLVIQVVRLTATDFSINASKSMLFTWKLQVDSTQHGHIMHLLLITASFQIHLASLYCHRL